MKSLATIAALFFAFVLITILPDLPAWGDPEAPVNAYVSAYYLTHALEQTEVPNVVTAVLADYRGFDTMFETCVVLIAGLAIIGILRQETRPRGEHAPEADVANPVEESIVVRTGCRIMVPLIQLFALYVVAHGHHSPGGGFQGGTMLGASLILLAIGFGLESALRRIRGRTLVIVGSVGVLIYSGIGAVSWLLGGNFLDYSRWSRILPQTSETMARSHGMLGVEIGVAVTVTAIMFAIYASLSTHGDMRKGL